MPREEGAPPAPRGTNDRCAGWTYALIALTLAGSDRDALLAVADQCEREAVLVGSEDNRCALRMAGTLIRSVVIAPELWRNAAADSYSGC